MNDKVKELIERVAQKLYDQYRGVDGKYIKSKRLSSTNHDSWKRFYIRALEVLNDKDLALIDRERLNRGLNPVVEYIPCNIDRLGTFPAVKERDMTLKEGLKIGYLPVIPLREALKESNDNQDN